MKNGKRKAQLQQIMPMTDFPIPVKVSVDGIEKKFGIVIADALPPGKCLGSQEVRCYKSNKQEPTVEDLFDWRASLVVSFNIFDAALAQGKLKFH